MGGKVSRNPSNNETTQGGAEPQQKPESEPQKKEPSEPQKKEPESDPQKKKPRLFLNFDVNKTCVMLDSSTNTSTLDLMCRVLSESCWGIINSDADGQHSWELLSKNPSSDAPTGCTVGNASTGLKAGDASTYSDFLEFLACPLSKDNSDEENADIKKERKDKKVGFTLEGAPGEDLRGFVDELCQQLLIPEDKKATCKASGISSLQGDNYFLIPSFFQCLLDLRAAGRDFWVCFRTFGHDHAKLVEEFNAFCTGSHPLYPNVKFDGTDGTQDLRIATGAPPTENKQADEDGGAVTAHPASMDVGCVERTGMGSEEAQLHLGVQDITEPAREHVKGFKAIFDWFCDRMVKPGSFLLRDHYQYWASQAEDSFAGKLHLVDRRNQDINSIFFDDNVERTFAHIIDARDALDGEKLPFEMANHCWYSKAVALHAISNVSYFTESIARCEANITKYHESAAPETKS